MSKNISVVFCSIFFLLTFISITTAAENLSDSPVIKEIADASELGSMTVASHFCPLRYDPELYSALIVKKMSVHGESFMKLLLKFVEYQMGEQDKMSGAEKAAYCSQMAQRAKSYGILR